MAKRAVVFVHGWSVTNTDTYGRLPDRLRAEGLADDTRHVFLGKYVSFRDEVYMADISRGFEAAIRDQLADLLQKKKRFVCITHSTGGPVVRDWYERFYESKKRPCPMSHLVMLAPANFGSSLAQLGKKRVGRLKAWFAGVEPGQRVLDWLELGSPEAWRLNRRLFETLSLADRDAPVFVFSLTGQTIDRKLYDHVNPYTGEVSSDGVVRTASANLNATYVKLEQVGPGKETAARDLEFKLTESKVAPETAFCIVPGVAHSGEDIGIIRSVTMADPHATVDHVAQCLAVDDRDDYREVIARFREQTAAVMKRELIEVEPVPVLPDRVHIHDPCSMVIFRVEDDQGHPLDGFDLLLTAGARASPDELPRGFLVDRQRNSKHRGTLTFFFNHAAMQGCDAVADAQGKVHRIAVAGASRLGLRINPFETTGYAHYRPGKLDVDREGLSVFIKPHATTLVDIKLHRIVREGVFQLTKDTGPGSFKGQPLGDPIDGHDA
jgi:hypothetical protein